MLAVSYFRTWQISLLQDFLFYKQLVLAWRKCVTSKIINNKSFLSCPTRVGEANEETKGVLNRESLVKSMEMNDSCNIGYNIYKLVAEDSHQQHSSALLLAGLEGMTSLQWGWDVPCKEKGRKQASRNILFHLRRIKNVHLILASTPVVKFTGCKKRPWHPAQPLMAPCGSTSRAQCHQVHMQRDMF